MESNIYSSIIASLNEGVVIIDSEGNIVAINAAAKRNTGLSDENMIGRSAMELFAAHPDLVDAIQHCAEQNKPEIKIQHKNTNRCISLDIKPLCREPATPDGYIIVFRDSAELSNTSEQLLQEMAEREQLEQQLRQTRKMEAVGRLAGGIAHDFNNLLTAIIGSAELGLQESVTDNKIHQHFLDIKNGALIASDLTGRLLNFGKERKLKRKYVSLNHIISDLLKMVSRILGEDIKLIIQLTSGLYPAFVDPDQIRQLIINLCTNARDDMPNGGTLTIRTDNLTDTTALNPALDIDRESSYVFITFADTGYAVSEETKNRLFGPFDSTIESDRASGLGLAVVQGIIQQHQGQIIVDSKINSGTVIQVYLPATPKMELAVETNEKQEIMVGGSETILLVEDNDMVLNVAMRLLDDLGYKVLVAHNAEEAMELFGRNMGKIDLVMSDVVMPRSSGPEMFSRIHAMQPELPALFVTGYDVNQSIETLEMLECRDNCAVLQKPYSQDALAEKIRELLNRKLS
ncbi:MAG: response regulator [Gammaproteobacteria bacterium]|nr:response regulator [Gammaproteobacteria bacterium]